MSEHDDKAWRAKEDHEAAREAFKETAKQVAEDRERLRTVRIERRDDSDAEPAGEPVTIRIGPRDDSDDESAGEPVMVDYLAKKSRQALSRIRRALEDPVAELHLADKYPGWRAIIDAVEAFDDDHHDGAPTDE